MISRSTILAFLVCGICAFVNGCGSGTVPTTIDKCAADLTECPTGYTDACLPGDKIVSSCCYENATGDRVPIGVCASTDAGVGGGAPDAAQDCSVTCDPFLACHLNDCSPGACSHSPLPSGFQCGDVTECKLAPTCDGAGVCAEHPKADGTKCAAGNGMCVGGVCQ